MKKITLIFVFLFITIATIKVYSQVLCEVPPGCQDPINWSVDQVWAFGIPPSLCYYLVTYRTGVDCNGKCVFKIMSISAPQPPGCIGTTDPVTLLDAASKALLQSNPPNFCLPDPLVEGFQNEWLVLIAACWHWSGPIPGPGGGEQPYLVPCDETSCCWCLWAVNIVSERGILKAIAQKVSCTTFVPCYDPQNCSVYCE